jgi:hypothetical protein
VKRRRGDEVYRRPGSVESTWGEGTEYVVPSLYLRRESTEICSARNWLGRAELVFYILSFVYRQDTTYLGSNIRGIC